MWKDETWCLSLESRLTVPPRRRWSPVSVFLPRLLFFWVFLCVSAAAASGQRLMSLPVVQTCHFLEQPGEAGWIHPGRLGSVGCGGSASDYGMLLGVCGGTAQLLRGIQQDSAPPRTPPDC